MKILEKHITRADTRDKNATKKQTDIHTSQSDVQVGDVFLVIWPDNKSSTGKKIRPALVIKRNASTAVCASITTHNPRTENGTDKVLPGEVQIPEQAAKKLGLKKASTIRLTEQHIIPVKYLIYCVTTFDTDTMNYINDELKALKSSNIEKYGTSPVNNDIKRKQNSDLYKQSKNLNESYFWEAKSESAYRNRYTGSWRTILPNNAIKVNRNDYKKVLHDKDAIAAVEEYFKCHKRAFQCVVSYWVKVDDNGVRGFINPNNRRSMLKYETDGETEIIEDLETLNNSSSNEHNFDNDDIDWDDVPEYNKEDKLLTEGVSTDNPYLKEGIKLWLENPKAEALIVSYKILGSDYYIGKDEKNRFLYNKLTINQDLNKEYKVLKLIFNKGSTEEKDALSAIEDDAKKRIAKSKDINLPPNFDLKNIYPKLDVSSIWSKANLQYYPQYKEVLKELNIIASDKNNISNTSNNKFDNTKLNRQRQNNKRLYNALKNSGIDVSDFYQQYQDKAGRTRLKATDKCNKLRKEIYGESLTEDIEKHDELNPKLWNEDGTLKEEVHDKIINIANSFMEDLKQDGIKFDLKDIRLVGSNCSYNYTKDSDLDIHLIADSSSLNCPDDLYPLLYSSYRSIFNKNLDIDFYGIPVEIYVEVE